MARARPCPLWQVKCFVCFLEPGGVTFTNNIVLIRPGNVFAEAARHFFAPASTSSVIATYNGTAKAPAAVYTATGKGAAFYVSFYPGFSYFLPAMPVRPTDRGGLDSAYVSCAAFVTSPHRNETTNDDRAPKAPSRTILDFAATHRFVLLVDFRLRPAVRKHGYLLTSSSTSCLLPWPVLGRCGCCASHSGRHFSRKWEIRVSAAFCLAFLTFVRNVLLWCVDQTHFIPSGFDSGVLELLNNISTTVTYSHHQIINQIAEKL